MWLIQITYISCYKLPNIIQVQIEYELTYGLRGAKLITDETEKDFCLLNVYHGQLHWHSPWTQGVFDEPYHNIINPISTGLFWQSMTEGGTHLGKQSYC